LELDLNIEGIENKSSLPRLISVGTANPPEKYTQQEVLELFKCSDPSITRFFLNSHIQTRHLVLPKPDKEGRMPQEDGKELLEKHKKVSIEIGKEAIEKCLAPVGLNVDRIDFFATVSTTGFLCPGISAYLAPEMGFRQNIHRADLLGMGCNGGMNGLMTTFDFAKANPGRNALLLTCEVCSAAYVFDLTVRTGVVNSLFGDGAAAVLLRSSDDLSFSDGPMIVDFESHIISQAIDEMRFDFDKGKFNFFLGREVPYLIGKEVEKPVFGLLERNGLKKRDISHWLIHSGGKKVVDAIKYNLGITEYDVRHTRSILKNYGNLSSASFIFSFLELTREEIAREGDWGVSIAMGPGISIETGLIRW